MISPEDVQRFRAIPGATPEAGAPPPAPAPPPTVTDPEDAARLERIRANLYDLVSSAKTETPDVARMRGILSRLPKAAPLGTSAPGPSGLPTKRDLDRGTRARPPITKTGVTDVTPSGLAEDALGAAGQAGTYLGDVLDVGTFGVYRKARDALNGIILPEGAAQQTRDYEAKIHADNPIKSDAARALGYVNPYGGPGLLAREVSTAVGAGAKALAPTVESALARLALRTGAGAATGAGTTAATSLVERSVAGEPITTAVPNALGDAPLGAAVGGVGGLLAGASAMASKKLRSPKTEIGNTIATLEKNRRTIASPEFKALPGGAPGSNMAAADAEEALAARVQEELAQARAHYGAEQGRIFAKHGDRVHLMVGTDEALSKLERENTTKGGVVGDEPLGRAISKLRQMLTTDTGIPDTAVNEANKGAARNAAEDAIYARDAIDLKSERPDRYLARLDADRADRAARAAHKTAAQQENVITAPAATVEDIIKAKRLIAGQAEHGMPATAENRPYRVLDQVLARELESIDPEIADLNAQYARQMQKLETANEILYGEKAPEARGSLAQKKRATGALGRLGDSTQAATTGQNRAFERLKALDPAYEEILNKVEAKKEFERSRFGAPHVSRRIEHAFGIGTLLQNANALSTRAIDPALQTIAGQSRAVRGPQIGALRGPKFIIDESPRSPGSMIPPGLRADGRALSLFGAPAATPANDDGDGSDDEDAADVDINPIVTASAKQRKRDKKTARTLTRAH